MIYENTKNQSNMKNLKVLFTVLCVACATAVWGESIEINTSNSGVTGSYANNTFTISNVQFGYTQWMKNTNIQAKKSTTNSCYNVEAIPGTITKITVVQTGTARAIKMFGGTTAKPTSSITSPSTALTMVFDFSDKGYTYFSITTPSNACYFQTITIEYESIGSTETTNYTVRWSLGGVAYTAGDPTTSVKSGEQVSTLPTAPNGDAIGSCANTFMGWSTHNLGSETGQGAPRDLFTTIEGSPVITQDTTFYAVFATKQNGN